MEMIIHHLLAPFYPAGIERVRNNQTHSISNVQPYYSAGHLPAKENNQMKKKLVLTVLIVLAILTLAACTLSMKLSPAKGAAYAAEVDEYVESYFAGSSECDFNKAYRGFDPVEWEGLLDEGTFQQECKADLATIGAYQSKKLDYVIDQGDLRCVIYKVVYENDQDVKMRVCFYKDDPDHLIVGTLKE